MAKKRSKIVRFLTEVEEQRRKTFCCQVTNKDFIDNVFLTDESSFQLNRNTLKVWSSKHSRHPGKKVPKFFQKKMVCGALSKKDLFLHIYSNKDNVDLVKYEETLAAFLPYANSRNPSGCILEHDGATPHRT